jgi:hypothetical protein
MAALPGQGRLYIEQAWKRAGCEPRRHADLADPPKGWLFSGLGLAAVRQLAAVSVAILS